MPDKSKADKAKHKGATSSRSRKVKRPRESRTALRARTGEIVRRLRQAYPDATTALDHANAYQLLVATILSAQCTDERVNMVTPGLFRRYPEPADLADARPLELEEMIRSTGFFHNKARSLLGMAEAVVARHGGEIPSTMEQLTALPGVGRKTANVVLGNAFHENVGVVVDTHVKRLSGRLGLSARTDPDRIEQDLMTVVPREDWTDFAHLLIHHGRAVCAARKPRCGECVLVDLCPSAFIAGA